jgi:geranylgeranyl reductase family protein
MGPEPGATVADRRLAGEPVWDVAVVGAGPAGGIAACVAAEAGARVVLLDRASIPRYKTCGGGLIGTTQRLASEYIGLSGHVSARVQAATVTLDGSRSFTRRVPDGDLLEMVNRDEFDAALVRAAQGVGVELRQRTAVRGLAETEDRVVLQTSDGSVAARVVIGADGSAGRVGNYVGVRCRQVDLGLEVELPATEAMRSEWRGRMLLDWGPIPGSYGWLFPKADTLTVGVIAARGAGDQTRAYLADLVDRLGFAAVRPTTSSGHLTRCRREDSPLRRGRVVVVGDAAGLLEPWTREGISFALRSGRMAGEAAARAAASETTGSAGAVLAGYERAVTDTLVPEMRAGTRILRAFGRHPIVFHAGLATPAGWRHFIRFCRGETNFAKAMRHRGVAAGLSLIAASPDLGRDGAGRSARSPTTST